MKAEAKKPVKQSKTKTQADNKPSEEKKSQFALYWEISEPFIAEIVDMRAVLK
jgi:hypothetical protein